MSIVRNKSFGKGLDDILSASKDIVSKERSIVNIPINALTPCRYQSRTNFDQDSLGDLSASIKIHGVLQPILARLYNGEYEIIAGERRFRAAQQAGLSSIPAIIFDVDDNSVMAFTLIENIQREALNPIEEARGISILIENQKLTHAQVAELIGKSRSQTTNMLRLLTLSIEVQSMVESSELDMGHARCLLTLDKHMQIKVAEAISFRKLSVRETEEYVRKMQNGNKIKQSKINNDELDSKLNILSKQFEGIFGLDVSVRADGRNGYKLIVSARTIEELEDILESNVV